MQMFRHSLRAYREVRMPPIFLPHLYFSTPEKLMETLQIFLLDFSKGGDVTREQTCGNKSSIKLAGSFSLGIGRTIASPRLFSRQLPSREFSVERSRAFFANPSSVNTQPYKATPDRNIIFAPFWDRKRACRREIVITSSSRFRSLITRRDSLIISSFFSNPANSSN